MHFYNLLNEIDDNIDLFIDMDGVISSYDFGKPLDFKNKRPLTTNINTLRKISEMNNVNLYILSVCRKDNEIEIKNNWLDKFAPFFEKDKRFVLSKETYTGVTSAELKLMFLKKYNTNNRIILVDDDNNVLKTISKSIDNIQLYQDSELID
jgi:hypothetical protein